MRHPPRSELLAVAGASALVRATTAGWSTRSTSQWGNGFQSSVRITNVLAVLGSWTIGFDFADGRKATRGRNELQRRQRSHDTRPTAPPPADPPPGRTGPALHGFGEFMCVLGRGAREGPTDDAAIKAIADWKAGARLIALNEECRLGLPTSSRLHQRRQGGGRSCRGARPDFDSRPAPDRRYVHGDSAGWSHVHAGCQKPMPVADVQNVPPLRAISPPPSM
ncbi:cellulose binding domain-containing protein [Streptomyces sp. NPDC001537]